MSQPEFDGTPQFNRAEYVGESGTDICAACHRPISESYYRVNGHMTCPQCAANANAAHPNDTHATFVRALLFGAGGALLGLILYSAFGIITGLVIGYLSLAVGYIVGKAMMLGSKGVGGRRYQIAAVLFTYAAVSMSAIPIGIAYMVKQRPAEVASKTPEQQLADDRPRLEAETDKTDSAPSQAQQQAPEQKSVILALGSLALFGLASPILELTDPIHGIIGLAILIVGIRIAWQMTGSKRPLIDGPFQNSAPAS